jgi:hypothetical protein
MSAALVCTQKPGATSRYSHARIRHLLVACSAERGNPPVCLLLFVQEQPLSQPAAAERTGPPDTAEFELRQGCAAAASGQVTCCQDVLRSAHVHAPKQNVAAAEVAEPRVSRRA